MTASTHIFRCYAADAADFIDVEATTDCIARAFAAEKRGWKYERVIARYVRTISGRTHDERDAELRKALAGVK
ncbi:MAG TPA: hypothetical protein VFW23_13975 [Tepidisphaeraceae bacterium]|nr:hypothetical protein [Tepidisphaeraceae bacterium]